LDYDQPVSRRRRIQRRYLGVVGVAEADVGHRAGAFHLLASFSRQRARRLF
jgi:hypothetical protein